MEKGVNRREALKTGLAILGTTALSVGYLAFLANVQRDDKDDIPRKKSGVENTVSDFRYPNELDDIRKHAQRVGVEPEILMAIRSAENGRDALAYGVIPQGNARTTYVNDTGYKSGSTFHNYSDEKEKQLCWAAWTVRKNRERFNRNSEGHNDFISYLASKYAPEGVSNDPTNLNKNWERNVRHFYRKYKKN